MATLDKKFEDFRLKYDLTEEATIEMLAIFNETFIELAHKLLRNPEIQIPKSSNKQGKSNASSSNSTNGPKKFATKIAAEYASEKGYTLDDFDKEKINKKDIDEKIKNKDSNVETNEGESDKNENNVPNLITEICQEIKTTRKRRVEKCKGKNRDGTQCDKNGDQKPENCTNYYCFRHALDWKKYEVSSDSELEEEPELFMDLAIATED